MDNTKKCCPPQDVRGKALLGSVLSLDAIGPQDIYCLSKSDSNFVPSIDRSPPNAIYQRQRQFGEPDTQYFGNKVRMNIKTKEMGDILSNMYLKTKLPSLISDPQGTVENIQFPYVTCETLEPGESTSITNAELRSINVGASNADAFNIQTKNNKIGLLGYDDGNRTVSEQPQGYYTIKNGTLGTKIIDQELFSSVDPATPTNFRFSANVSTQVVQQYNVSKVDGGLKNLELFGLFSKPNKEYNMFKNYSYNNDIDDPLDFQFTVDNEELFNYNGQSYKLNWIGGSSFGSVAIGGDSKRPIYQIIESAISRKFRTEIKNVNNYWTIGTRSYMDDYDFWTNVTVDNDTIITNPGSGYSWSNVDPISRFFVVLPDKVFDIDVTLSGPDGSAEVSGVKLNFSNKTLNYPDFDLSGEYEIFQPFSGVSSGRFKIDTGTLNKTNFVDSDTMGIIQASSEELRKLSSGSSFVEIADLNYKWYNSKEYTTTYNEPNLSYNLPRIQVFKQVLKNSYNYFDMKSPVGGFISKDYTLKDFNGLSLMYRNNYWPVSAFNYEPACDQSTNTYFISDTNLTNTWNPKKGQFSLYSNNSTKITLASNLQSGQTFITPPGSRFSGILWKPSFNDKYKFRLDGSVNPLVSISSPSGNSEIIFGAYARSNNPYMDLSLTYNEKSSGFSKTINFDEQYINWNDEIDSPWLFNICNGRFGVTRSELYNENNQLAAVANREGGASGIIMFSNVWGTDTGSDSDKQPPNYDEEVAQCAQFGGLVITVFSTPGEYANIYFSNTYIDIYSETTRIDQIQMFSDETTINYDIYSNSSTVTVENSSNSVSFNPNDPLYKSIVSNTLVYNGTFEQQNLTGQSANLEARGIGFVPIGGLNTNVFITQSISSTETFRSNGYVNISASTTDYHIEDDSNFLTWFYPELDSSSKVISVARYSDEPILYDDISNVAITEIIDQTKSPFVSGFNGNCVTYTCNNYLEIYTYGLHNPENLITPFNSLQFGERGYELYFTAGWDSQPNCFTVNTLKGTYQNKQPGQTYTYNFTNSNAYWSSDSKKYSMVARDYEYTKIQSFWGNITDPPLIVSDNLASNNKPSYFSPLSITLSTANRLNKTYSINDPGIDKISLLPPHDLTTSPGTNNVFFNATNEVYSGPTYMNVNTTNLTKMFGSSYHSTNVAYTQCKFTGYINNVENVSVTTTTYNPTTTLSFDTYSNTLTMGSNTVSIQGLEEPYGTFLLSNTLQFNSSIDLGENVTNESSSIIKIAHTASFQYSGNVYILGGYYTSSTDYNYSSACYRVSSNVNTLAVPGGENYNNGYSTFIGSLPFEIAYGSACLDTDRNYVYLFGTNGTRNLYRCNFDPINHTLEGNFTIESTSFPYFYWFFGGLVYVANKVVVAGGTPYVNLNPYPYGRTVYYYDTNTRSWKYFYNYSMNRIYSPGKGCLGSDGNIYIPGLFYPLKSGRNWWDSDTFWKLNPTTGVATSIFNLYENITNFRDVSMAEFDPNSEKKIFLQSGIVPYSLLGPGFMFCIDVQGGYFTGQQFDAPYDTIIWRGGASMFTNDIPDYYGNQVIVYGGTDGTNAYAGIFAITNASTNKYYVNYSVNVQNVEIIVRDATFIGDVTPGNILEVETGIEVGRKFIPTVQISENYDPTKYLQFGLNRTYVKTAYTDTNNDGTQYRGRPDALKASRETKGYYNSWKVETSVPNAYWDGRDENGNWSQTNAPGGPVWLGDALNTRTLLPKVYASNIIFNSTGSDLTSNTIAFQTSNALTYTSQRESIVPNFVRSSNVEYSIIAPDQDSGSNIFNYAINGTMPMSGENQSVVTIQNMFNPFVKENYDNYPSVEICYDTDNIYQGNWEFTFNTDLVDPPFVSGMMDQSNTVAIEVYRQYTQTFFKKQGRFEGISFKYGASRYAYDSDTADDTLQYGVVRDDIGTVQMQNRKINVITLSYENDLSNPSSKIQIYKYMPSIYSFPDTGDLRLDVAGGYYDEIAVQFGASTTASKTVERIAISPGYNRDTGRGTTLWSNNYTTIFDSIDVSFTNYNLTQLSVDVTLTYDPIIIQETIVVSKTFYLTPEIFNVLYNLEGNSGDMFITPIYNAGIVSSNVDYGSRPVYAGNDTVFSSNLLGTCCTQFSYLTDTSLSQENIMQEMHPIEARVRSVTKNGIYANNIGRAIIKSASLSVNGQLLQKLDDLWYVINDQLSKTDDEKVNLQYLINGGQEYLPTAPNASDPLDLYIPLDFFFCRTRKTSSTEITPRRVYDEYRSFRPYMPVCALTDQEITVEIEFYPKTYFTNSTLPVDLSYLNTYIITEEAIVSDVERLYLKNNPIEFQFETLSKLPTQNMSLTRPNIEQKYEGLVADFPVKMINWLFRSNQFEDINNSSQFLNRYNFSTAVSSNENYRLFFEIMNKASFYYEGVPIVDKLGSTDFYRYLQSLQTGLSSVNKNIYSYNFALTPTKTTPSGSLNFSNTNSNKTFLTFRLTTREQASAIEKVDPNLGVTIHAYAYGYNVLKIENNTITRLFS